MRNDFNARIEQMLAGYNVPQSEIDAEFKSCPWCQRLHVNGIVIERKDWRIDLDRRIKAAQKEKSGI